MRDLEKIQQFFELLKKNYQVVLEETEDSSYIAFFSEEYLAVWPHSEIYFEFSDKDECFFVAYDVTRVNVNNESDYLNAINIIGRWNDTYDLLKWSMSTDGVVSATYTDYNQFNGDLYEYKALASKVLNELNFKLGSQLFY